MNPKEIQDIIHKVYPSISKDYKSDAEVLLFANVFARLKAFPAIEEESAMAEYHWDENKILIYTDEIRSEEDVIRSLIHECVHSKQCYDLYIAYYEQCKVDYDTHPHEIEAEYEEENWKKYKLNTNKFG